MHQQMTWTPATRAIAPTGMRGIRRPAAIVAGWFLAATLLFGFVAVIGGVGWEAGPTADVWQPAAGIPARMPEPGPAPR